MSNQATNTAAAAAPAKAKKPSIVDTFLKGCAKGFKVGIENITPAMILGYVLVYILKETGLMDILGTVMSPVMGLFGLPGEAFAVLISAFFAKASGCATAASMYEAGALAAFNFETGYMDNRFVVGRKGGGPVIIKIHGRASHSGIAPEKGRSAVLEAAHKIVEIESQNDIMRGRLMNCGMVDGGIGENTIPDSCEVRIGIRFPNAEVRDEIFEILHRATEHNSVPDTTAELDLSRVMQCMDTTNGVMALFRHLQRTAQDCGFGEIGCFQVGGLSDSGITVACGVPTVCGMGVRGEGNHTPDEYAEVESLFQRSVLAACAAYTLNDDFAKAAE